VRCTVGTVRARKGKARKAKVTCVVTLASMRRGELRWSVRRGGRTYGQGVVFARDGRATLRIPRADRLRRGRYVLRIAGVSRGAGFTIG
jgi:hypothetical protein